MIYCQHIETPSYLCDVNDRLHTWAAVRLCQEVTEYHGNATGIGFKTLLKQNRAWVITRALYHIHRLPNAFEPIELCTWARGHNGLIAFRDYRMVAANGEVLFTGTSYWPLIDMTTRRVIRLHDVVSHYENHDELATGIETIDKIKLPELGESDLADSTTATFAMIDHTQHVNNSEYIKLMFNSLHASEFDTDRPFALTLNYLTESRLDESLKVYHRVVDGSHLVLIANPRAASVTARIDPMQ